MSFTDCMNTLTCGYWSDKRTPVRYAVRSGVGAGVVICLTGMGGVVAFAKGAIAAKTLVYGGVAAGATLVVAPAGGAAVGAAKDKYASADDSALGVNLRKSSDPEIGGCCCNGTVNDVDTTPLNGEVPKVRGESDGEDDARANLYGTDASGQSRGSTVSKPMPARPRGQTKGASANKQTGMTPLVPMGSSAEAGAAALAGGPDSGTAAQRAGMGGGAAGSVLTSPTIGGGSKAAPGAAAPGISASTSVASIASAESLEAGAVIRLPGTGAGSAPTVPVFTAAPAKGVAAIGGADPNTAYAAVTIGLAHQ